MNINRTDEVPPIVRGLPVGYSHLMTRIDHTGHDHPNTTAARTACRKAMAAGTFIPAPRDYVAEAMLKNRTAHAMKARMDREATAPTITTPVGKVRVGSEVVIEVRGEAPARYTVTEVSDNIKNGRPGVDAINDRRPCWAYADQIIKIVKF